MNNIQLIKKQVVYLNLQIFLFSIIAIKSIRNQKNKKVSGPNPLNQKYIHYSDIKINIQIKNWNSGAFFFFIFLWTTRESVDIAD